MARKMEVGIIGAAALMLVGKILLDHPDDTKKAATDAIEVVADTGEAVKNQSLEAVTNGTAPAAQASVTPAPVAGQ